MMEREPPKQRSKLCGMCGKKKPLAEFYKLSRSADGHQSRCKSCQGEYHNLWKEKQRARHKNRKTGVPYQQALPRSKWGVVDTFLRALVHYAREAENQGVPPNVSEFLKTYAEYERGKEGYHGTENNRDVKQRKDRARV